MKTTSEIEKYPDKPKKTQKNLFFSGVLILTVSNILIKLIGALFKVPMVSIIGNEGMGYFNLTYTIYVWFYMISTAGLPVAVSVMISEARAKGNLREVKTIFKLSTLLFLCIGFFGMSVMMAGSHLFAALMDTPPIYSCVIAIAPTLFFICISSSIRGYFQGYQNMLPTAISQLIEALGKLILGIIFGLYAMRAGYSLPIVAAYSISGLTIGAAAGMIFLVFTKMFFRDRVYDAEYIRPDSYTMDVRPTRTLLRRLVSVAIPITISASVMSLTSLIDGMIIVRCLKTAGFVEEVAVALYGNYTSLAVPMFNLPPILIYPISYSLIPLISASLTEGDHDKTMNIMTSALRIVAIIAIPCTVGLSVLAEPILRLLYDAEKSAMAAPLLSVLALSVYFLGMLSISNAILQANGYERKP
ncbi:MAG: polysaccharide biosynthesis protein, partial [Eubacteriales bacterium]